MYQPPAATRMRSAAMAAASAGQREDQPPVLGAGATLSCLTAAVAANAGFASAALPTSSERHALARQCS